MQPATAAASQSRDAFHRQVLSTPHSAGAECEASSLVADRAALPPSSSSRHGFTYQRYARPGCRAVFTANLQATCRLSTSATVCDPRTHPRAHKTSVSAANSADGADSLLRHCLAELPQLRGCSSTVRKTTAATATASPSQLLPRPEWPECSLSQVNARFAVGYDIDKRSCGNSTSFELTHPELQTDAWRSLEPPPGGSRERASDWPRPEHFPPKSPQGSSKLKTRDEAHR